MQLGAWEFLVKLVLARILATADNVRQLLNVHVSGVQELFHVCLCLSEFFVGGLCREMPSSNGHQEHIYMLHTLRAQDSSASIAIKETHPLLFLPHSVFFQSLLNRLLVPRSFVQAPRTATQLVLIVPSAASLLSLLTSSANDSPKYWPYKASILMNA